MSASNATVTVADIVLSPMRVTFTPPGGSAHDLGGTTGGVTLSIKTDLAEIMVDQLGKTTLDQAVAGHHFQIKLDLAELTDKLRIWKTAFPYMNLVTDGSGHYLGIFVSQIASRMAAMAGVLLLHPLSLADGDHSQDITIELAACQSAAEVKYGPDKQSGLACTFQVYPNMSVIPARFMRYGDTSIGVVNATAAAAVPGSNTGNGAITLPVAFNGATVTETVTILCIAKDSGNGNIFSVTGSVSGLLGNVILAAANGSVFNFVSSKLTFTITQGTVEFVDTDSFTIATVASNYA